MLAHGEAIVEFEDDLEESKQIEENITLRTDRMISKLKEYLDDKKVGQIIRDGLDISIVGPPNSGKSSLLNTLAKQDIAIVSDIPGTTRDIVSQSLGLKGMLVNLHDTAGLRESEDQVENIGIERAKSKAN